MTWREALIARVLLIIARMVCDDPELRSNLRDLSTHIAVNHDKERPLPDALTAA